MPWTVDALGQQISAMQRQIDRIEQDGGKRVTSELFQAVTKEMKEDITHLETKYDRIIENQLTSQRQQIIQLVAILVTLVVAAIGAWPG